MPARLEQDVPAHLRGERADKIVAELAGVSREQARRLFEHGVKVDGTAVEPNKRVAGGSIDFPVPPEEIGTVAEEVDFEVSFEDSQVLVVDKPAGITVHPGAGRRTGTLASGLLHRYPDLEGIGQEGRWGIVHRLDQGTSGLLLVAQDRPVLRVSDRPAGCPTNSPVLPGPGARCPGDADRHHRCSHREGPLPSDPQEGRARRPSGAHPLSVARESGDDLVAGSRFGDRPHPSDQSPSQCHRPPGGRGPDLHPPDRSHSFAPHLPARRPPGFHPPR